MVITCGVKVLRDEPISVPPSNILSHLGGLLDSADGSDVSFVVDGEEFAAHRAVLIARSPVFKAQLLGSMADAKMTSTTLQDIAPATFRVMLRYMYTDEFPEDAELVTEKLQDLFVAADRFALDRLKLFCAGKLWIEVSVDTVGAALAWAETYNCPELKKKCIDFLADEKNFRKVVLTDGFIQMVQKFPSVLAELRVKFKLNFEETKSFAIGQVVTSGDISAGGHLWMIECYPCGDNNEDNGEYLGVFLHHESKTKDVKAIFEVFVMDRNGAPSPSHRFRLVHVYKPKSKGNNDNTWGENRFVKRSDLESLYLTNGLVIIMCGVEDIAPTTFKAMLQFIYTDDLPRDEEDGDEQLPTEAFQDLLAAADRFALDRLKLMCAKKLWDDVSTDTVGATLACAEAYSCPELKMKCIDFFANEKNFKEAVLTDGFVQLVQKFPAILGELRVKVVGA
ncbi:hypothetical protein HU200_061889 [Digitaria exilis]|uniref:Uncharacterized protein n=1 Tax=Digitaria exilis TaxID=1010633 RepID=A0A835DYQ6_9POAL|nr:hypothetical protein HU200_061889 [Digitaria exilis]